jgi:prenylcysteine oxidase/farnesylcysteine lyase
MTLQVTDIHPYIDENGDEMFQLMTNVSTKDIDKPFDNVFFAAPWHSSPISKSLADRFTEAIPWVSPPSELRFPHP